ncbi:MAG TPA: hypothetical protein ENK96_01870, partial [Desulfobulbaceae bacterium]|nr:hypothetical protein [Desulfobulbaceae bacterium]
MAEKTGNKVNSTLHDNWFDLIPKEDRDALEAKQWQTESRQADDESALGNLHYGMETERDSLRGSTNHQTMEHVHSEVVLPEERRPQNDATTHRFSTGDNSDEYNPRVSTGLKEASLSAEALSSGDATPLAVDTPSIARVDSDKTIASSPENPTVSATVIQREEKIKSNAGTGEENTLGRETPPAAYEEPSPQHATAPREQSGNNSESINNSPHAVDDSITTKENTSITLDVLANDSDADGDNLHVTEVFVGENQGAVILNDDNTIAFDPGTDFDHLSEGETQDVEISYTVDDGHGGTDAATATVTVTGTNDGPVAADDATGTTENAAVKINV